MELFHLFLVWKPLGVSWKFRVLEGMSQYLEVKVTWEQHKISWRSGLTLVTDGKRALGAEWTGCCPYDSYYRFWIWKGILNSSTWRCLGKKVTLEADLHEDGLGKRLPWRLIHHWGRWKKSVPDPGKPDPQYKM